MDTKEYWNKRLSSHYDLIGVGDISQTFNYNKWSYLITRGVLSKNFRVLSKNKIPRVMDLGSGTGFVINIWKQFNATITGVDISDIAVQNLKNIFPEDSFFECNLGVDSLPAMNESIDIVSAASVLYHIIGQKELNDLLKEVNRVLVPGGHFIFTDNFVHKDIKTELHQQCRTLEEYTRAILDSGFSIVNRKPNYVLFNDPVDTDSKMAHWVWQHLTGWSRRWKWFDKIIWPLLYPLEFVLVNTLKESPAQELLVCKKNEHS